MPEVSTMTFHIWATYALVIAAIVGFASERIRVEITSLLIMAALLMLFEFFPLTGPNGENLLNAHNLLAGFANPALIAVVALLILGNGLWRSGALDWTLGRFLSLIGKRRFFALGICFATVFVASPFVNNTPVVVIFIPILETIVRRFSMAPSKVMMPLSFVAILAGMLTLIGSSTNLLVSGALSQLGREPLGFFDFTIPGLILAAVGVIYIILVGPRLLHRRNSPIERFIAGDHRRFITQFTVGDEPKLLGLQVQFNLLRIQGARLILLQRGERALSPPYGQNLTIQKGDVLVVMATHDALTEAQTKFPNLMFSMSGEDDIPSGEEERRALLSRNQVVAEVMIAPGSRLAGYTLEDVGFRTRYGCLVLGIERRSQVIRRLIGNSLREGDVLVVQGDRQALDSMREHRGIIVLDGTERPLPVPRSAKLAGAIFFGTIVVASTGTLPIAAAAVVGSTLMLISGVLTLNQATNAMDRRIFLMVGASLALGAAMLKTGAAAYLAQSLLGLLG
ncbi:SLC13 family permease [Aestuariispira ectoiniformans]|uniref:SLC13 family permease n=1 Tax=Aestuariispira ectoiniformans TaxID=2775080 RepID=UPI00223BB5BB|nr:SLC13 family permease [Aestuariispira ectoiniformans]